MKSCVWMTLILLMLIVLVPDALADGRNPGSCLLFPYFDTTGATMSIHTIMNTGTEDVWIRMVFVESEECKPYDFFFQLGNGDTFTFGAHGLLIFPMRGFMYTYVIESKNQLEEKKADVLVGQEIVMGFWDNRLVQFSLNAVSFQALELVKDQKLHLDGTEYTCAPKSLYFPRFFGQDSAFYSRVMLINLTGGQYFSAAAECLIYNDNGQVFNNYVTFDCFELMRLTDLSGATSRAFLLATSHDPSEPWPFYQFAETGAVRIRGVKASNPDMTVKISDPSVFAVLVEGVGSLGYTAADLPLQVEDPSVYNHAMLWSTDPSGN